jgi:hypothetical protein
MRLKASRLQRRPGLTRCRARVRARVLVMAEVVVQRSGLCLAKEGQDLAWSKPRAATTRTAAHQGSDGGEQWLGRRAWAGPGHGRSKFEAHARERLGSQGYDGGRTG